MDLYFPELSPQVSFHLEHLHFTKILYTIYTPTPKIPAAFDLHFLCGRYHKHRAVKGLMSPGKVNKGWAINGSSCV